MARKRQQKQLPDGNLTPEPRLRQPRPKERDAFQHLIGQLPKPYYRTARGAAYLGDALALLRLLPAKCIDLVVTSPPFPLIRKKAYGNETLQRYVSWFQTFAGELHRVLSNSGSLVLELGGAWHRGAPVRSVYQFELIIELTKTFYFAQEFYYFNTAKLPTPAEWVTVRRCRLKDAVTTLWWLSKSQNPRADNRRVLYPYGARMEQLLRNGYNAGLRPSQHEISTKWGRRNLGAISPNILVCPNTNSTDPYFRKCHQNHLRPHPARFPSPLPRFFIRFLSRPGDVVLDPFAGSNVTGFEAEANARFWLAFERDPDYVRGSSLRFLDRPPAGN